MRIKSVITCAALAPLLAGATEPVRLKSSSPWVLDYAENSCRLIRTFGEGDAKTTLVFESDAPGDMDMLVIGKNLESFREQIPAWFLPIPSKPFDGRSAVSTEKKLPAVLWPHVHLLPESIEARLEEKAKAVGLRPRVRPPALDPAEQAAIRAEQQDFASKSTQLEILPRRNRPVILETGSLGAPMKLFTKCLRDSLRDWGVDPDLEDRIARPVWAPDPAEWFSSSDYPPAMMMRGEQSEVSVRLLVDASGRVTKCTSLSHFKAPEFNRIVCDKMTKRGRFEPAELADGTKVPSYYTNRVVFRMAR
jgi:TonB family protein